jgi:hypothetical protein
VWLLLPLSFIVKDDKMKKHIIAGLIAAGVLVSNASAALTATDVPMTTATSDVTLVFLAVLGVSIVLFGFRKILGLTGK